MNPHNPVRDDRTTPEASKPAQQPHEGTFRKGEPGDKGERDHRGRFTAGNKGGPGNPFARRTAALRQALLDAVTEDDLQTIIRQLIQKAREGDVSAARLVLSYSIGKPDKAVDPDTLDRQEWQLLQQGAIANQDFLGLLGALQAPLACTILRALLPHLQQSVAQQLKEQLQEPAPAPAPRQGQAESEPDREESPRGPASGRTAERREQRQQTAARSEVQPKPAPRETAKTERPAAEPREARKDALADRVFLEAEEAAWLDFLREVTGQAFVGQADNRDQEGQTRPEGDQAPKANGVLRGRSPQRRAGEEE